MVNINPITIFGDLVITALNFQRYNNGRLAIETYGDDLERIGVLTVNVPEAKLNMGEVLIKDWSENEEMAHKMIEAGHIILTGRVVPTGHVTAKVATLSKNLLEAATMQ